MATSVLNPKGILLFFSYFPQFISPDSGNVPQQIFQIGALFTVMCGLVYGMYGFFAGTIGERVASKPRFTRAVKWVTGSVLIGLGVRTAVLDRR